MSYFLKRKNFFLGLLFLLAVSLIPVFFFRASYLEPYDLSYVQDHYHHSQWEIPNSPWGIGDDGFYQYAGYELVNGVDPYMINPEAPPLGKYLYGASIKFLNNPYYVILPIYLLTIFAFYLLTSFFIQKNSWRIFATSLFITSPLFFSQLGSTTLDLLQFCWLLLHMIAILSLSSAKKHWRNISLIIFAGVTLGLFIGTKFGLLAFFLVVSDAFILFKQKRYLQLIPIILISGIVYILLYFNHFLLGGNIITWLKGQKWILNYWLNNQPKGFPFLIFATIFSGLWIKLERVREWTILWPLGMGAFIINIYLIVKKHINDLAIIYVTIFVFGFFAVFTFNFFWARYLLIPLPFLIIFLVNFLSKRNLILTIVVVFLTFISIVNNLFFTLDSTKKEIKYALENGLYQDLYNYLPTKFQSKYSRTDFDKVSSLVDFGLGLPTKEVSLSEDGKISITYKTKIGTFINSQPISYINENGRWKIIWNWNFLLPGFMPGDTVEIFPETYSPGSVIDSKGDVSSIWGELPFVSVIPKKIQEKDREVFLKNLATSTGKSKENLRILLYVQSRKNWVVPIGFIKEDLIVGEATVKETRRARLTTSVQCEKLLNTLKVESGGKIIMTNKEGKKVILYNKTIGC